MVVCEPVSSMSLRQKNTPISATFRDLRKMELGTPMLNKTPMISFRGSDACIATLF